jgi:hypothetical protein
MASARQARGCDGWRAVVTIERSRADVAQLAERVLGKDEVTSSILVIGSIRRRVLEDRERALARCRGECGRGEGGQPSRRQAITKALDHNSNGETQAWRKKNLTVQSHT